MKSTDNRKLFDTPIGASAATGNIATIPATQGTAGDGTASLALAFPPETFIARAAGGEPPRGADMNGFLNLLSSAMQVLQAGYLGPFDASFAAGIGGYPAGAIVSGSVAGTFWVSTADANTTTPGETGAKWQNLFNGLAVLSGGNVLTGDQDVIGNIRSWSAQYAGETLVTTASGASLFQHNATRGGSADAYIQLGPSAINTHLGVVAYKADVSSAVTALQTSISNEASRAQAAEATKPNLSGNNTYTGGQLVNGSVIVQSGGIVSAIANDGSKRRATLYAGSAGQVSFWDDAAGTELGFLNIQQDGSVITSLGTMALTSQLPSAQTTRNGVAGSSGGYTIIKVSDSSTPSGYRYRMMGETADISSESSVTITLPQALNGVFPGAYGASTKLVDADTTATTNDQAAQIRGTPSTTQMVINMNSFGGGSQYWPIRATWWIEGW
ncbi:MAG: hypothetical protein ABF888_08120 [Acetobacter papayae]